MHQRDVETYGFVSKLFRQSSVGLIQLVQLDRPSSSTSILNLDRPNTAPVQFARVEGTGGSILGRGHVCRRLW